MLDGRDDGVPVTGHDGAAGGEDFVRAQYSGRVGQQAALVTVQPVGAGAEQAQQVPAGVELAIGRIEHRREVWLRFPDQPETMVAGGDGHQRQGDFLSIRHEPPGRVANSVQFRTAGFVLQVFESGEESLGFVGALAAGTGQQRKSGQVEQLPVAIRADARFHRDGVGRV